MKYEEPKLPRTVRPLPQLGKSNRIARRHGPRSEFIIMCEGIAHREQVEQDRRERIRTDYLRARAAA